jgi:hypothetical protein
MPGRCAKKKSPQKPHWFAAAFRREAAEEYKFEFGTGEVITDEPDEHTDMELRCALI